MTKTVIETFSVCEQIKPILVNEVQSQPGLEAVAKQCVALVANEFDSHAAHLFTQLPLEVVVAILGHPAKKALPINVSR